MTWQIARFFAALALLVAPWVYLPESGPTPQAERFLISALGFLAMLGWVPSLPMLLRRQMLGRLTSISLVLAALLSVAAGTIQFLGWSDSFQPWISATHVGTAYANLLQRNHFASLTVLGLGGVLYWANTEANWGGRPALLLMSGFALGAGNALSSSRIGFVELLCVIGLAWHWQALSLKHLPHRRILIATGLGYALSSIALWVNAAWWGGAGGIFGRLQEQIPQCASRLVLWKNVLFLITQKPWLGWGWGELAYAHFMVLYPDSRFCDILDNAHNLPLHLAFSMGVPVAGGACMGLMWWVLRSSFWRSTDASSQFAFVLLLVLGLHSMVEYPLWYGPFQLILVLALWLLWEVRTSASTVNRDNRWDAVIAWVAPGLTLAFLAVGLYAAWDYWRISQIYLPSNARAERYRDDTLYKLQSSWLFHNQVRFAELSTAEISPDNAEKILALATEMLHFSPEPMVVEKLLDSALLLGRKDVLKLHLERFRRAFPIQHAAWMARNIDRLPLD